MTDTNYKLNNVDLGNCLISRDYFNEVYSAVNTSYKRNALWAWGYIPSEINPTGTTVFQITPYMVIPMTTCSFFSPGWKDFHISTSGANTSIRLLDIQGKMYLWGCFTNTLYTGNTTSTASLTIACPTATTTTYCLDQCSYTATKLGKDHTQASISYLNQDGTAYAWGNNYAGMLGNGTTLNQGMLPTTTYNPTGGDIISIICSLCSGMYSSHMLNNRIMYFWGLHSTIASRLSRPVALSTFPTFTAQDFCATGATLGVVLDSGSDKDLLVLMGYNDKGQLGNSTTINCIGYNTASFSNTNPSLYVKSFSLGHCSSFAVASNGTLWAWGDNTYGQLGTNKTISTSCPIQSIDKNNNWKYVTTNRMGTAVAALKTDGSLWVWGEVQYVQGDPTGSCVRRSSPVQVGTKKNWVKIAIASCHSTQPTAPTYMLGLTEEDL